MRIMVIFFLLMAFSQLVQAEPEAIINGQSGQKVELSQVIARVQPGSILIIGENHGLRGHQSQQLQILRMLQEQGFRISVGMEFLTYTQQAIVDSYRKGDLSEVDFLKAISWGEPSFDYYREQILFPSRQLGETTIALNAPRSLTGRVAKSGLGSLTDAEKALLPPQFELGRSTYKERFLEMIKPHLPNAEAGERYFQAQCVWDDTMAWQAVEYVKNHPQQVFVIIVGEFHVQYGGGLPDRIRQRSDSKIPVLSLSQFNSVGLKAEEVQAEVSPSETYGPRADFVWIRDSAD